ncbi:MAG: hypothetical protein WD055_00375 [Candidatus Dependentiae bacterium]
MKYNFTSVLMSVAVLLCGCGAHVLKSKSDHSDFYAAMGKYVRDKKMVYNVKNNTGMKLVVWGIPSNDPPYTLAVINPGATATITAPSTLSKLYVVEDSVMMQGGGESAKKSLKAFESFIKKFPKKQWAILPYELGFRGFGPSQTVTDNFTLIVESNELKITEGGGFKMVSPLAIMKF